MSAAENNCIKIGDYIVLQKQKYNKLHKFCNEDTPVILGKDKLELKGIANQKYGTTFKLVPQDGKKRVNSLEVCNETDMRNLREVLGVQISGIDNRNIYDDGESQTLKSDDISKLREICVGSSQILEKIVENSKTFNSKTEYAQEKYLKKKERKYFEFVQIRKPTIRLLAEIYYRQNPEKVMGIRTDMLSQILSYAGIYCYGNFLLYESGTNGLLPAAILNAMGANTEARLVHMHPGNESQKQAVLALNFPEEQLKRCISVNIYSVLREFHQSCGKFNNSSNEEKDEDDNDVHHCKRRKLDEDARDDNKSLPKWKIENGRALELLHEKFDCLIVVAKEHPSTIITALLPFLKSSKPIVVYNTSKEILMEIYVEMKSTANITGLHLISNWMRFYQILPNRTHPEVSMNNNSGYLLHGYCVR